MKVTPNLRLPMRVLYGVFGLAAIFYAMAMMSGWPRAAIVVIGVLSFLEGAVGW